MHPQTNKPLLSPFLPLQEFLTKVCQCASSRGWNETIWTAVDWSSDINDSPRPAKLVKRGFIRYMFLLGHGVRKKVSPENLTWQIIIHHSNYEQDHEVESDHANVKVLLHPFARFKNCKRRTLFFDVWQMTCFCNNKS